MGFYKNKQIEWDERGYSSIDTVVCRACVGDYALKAFIKNNGQKQKCSYCRKVRICVDVEDLLRLIVRSANAEYEDATNCMYWNGSEGGYQGADVFDNWDFVYQVLNYEMEIEDDDLLRDIIDTLNDSVVWCESNPYNLRIHEEDYKDWANFCKEVQTDKSSISEMALNYDILNTIGEYVESLELITVINKKNGFFRSRAHKKIERADTAKNIGSAPTEYAEENRMSEKGVSTFYGAYDIETSLTEIDSRSAEIITTAKFFPTQKIKILDLTRLESIQFPSLFDENNREKRSPLIFLKNFSFDISKPIDETNKCEYRPTQVFTEYLRNQYLFHGERIDGIVYESSKNPGHKCCALFFDNEKCTDKKNEQSKKLWMDRTSIIRKDLL